MKTRLKAVLQKTLGYRRYLGLFARVKVWTLPWDRRERDFFHFLSLLPPDGLALDVGANLGYSCVHLARRLSRGRVLAFEPQPDNYDVLADVLRHFGVGNAEAFPWAIGDRAGCATMVLPVQDGARQQGLAHVVDGDPIGGAQTFEVVMRRLDDLSQVTDASVRVVAMKVDVEDFEARVLAGASAVLRRDRPIVFLELWHTGNRAACLAIAADLQYRVMVRVRGDLVPFEAASHRRHTQFFLLPPR